MQSNVDLVIQLLKDQRITGEDKARITAALLDDLLAIPIADVIKVATNGQVLINEKPLDIEQARAFREGCKALYDSSARKIIQDQIKYKAIKMGIYDGLTPDMIVFSKAALWCIQEENKLLSTLAAD